jgi:hypothetical protein
LIGKEQLCALSDKDVENESVVKRIENKTGLVFLSLRRYFKRSRTYDRRILLENDSGINRQHRMFLFLFPWIYHRLPKFRLVRILSSILIVDISTFHSTSQPDINPHNSPSKQRKTPVLTTPTDVSVNNQTTTTTVTVQSTARNVSNGSNMSIAEPAQDSAGGGRVWAPNEKASDVFANNLLLYITSIIWPDGIILDWVEGRKGQTDLAWRNKYRSSCPFSPSPTLPRYSTEPLCPNVHDQVGWS